jgi:hypothetical protein
MVAPATYQITIAFLGCSPNRDIHTTVYLRLLLYDRNDKTICLVAILTYNKFTCLRGARWYEAAFWNAAHDD